MNRHYTSIEQSKHLLELGLKAETADMQWFLEDNYGIVQIKEDLEDWGGDCTIPCWSVGALLMLMPNGSFIKKSDFGSYFCQGVIYNTPIEAVYAYMVNLLQSNQ